MKDLITPMHSIRGPNPLDNAIFSQHDSNLVRMLVINSENSNLNDLVRAAQCIIRWVHWKFEDDYIHSYLPCSKSVQATLTRTYKPR